MIMSSWCSTEQKFIHRTISAANTLLGSCHRTNITTVEGIGSQKSPHMVQTRLAECHAIQCGYDTPGTVVSMYGLLLNKVQPTMTEVEAALVGNLSRATGYRAILEAFKVFTEKPNPDELSKHEAKLPAALKKKDFEAVVLREGVSEWHFVPELSAVRTLQEKSKNFVVVYGLPTPEQVAGKNVVIDVSYYVDKKVTSTALGLEATANVTVAGLADGLEALAAGQQSQLTKELVQVLRTVKTPQWRNSTGLGDAVAGNKEVQVALLSVGAKLVASDIKGVEKTLGLKDKNCDGYTMKTLLIPTQAPSNYFLFCRVGARKANASGTTCAALSVALNGQNVSKANMFIGRTNEDICATRLDATVLEGKSLASIQEWSGEIKKVAEDKMTQNLVFKLVQDLSTLVIGSSEEKTELEERRWPSRSKIETTQFSLAAKELDPSSSSPIGQPVPMVS